jgi:hypothetical protein
MSRAWRDTFRSPWFWRGVTEGALMTLLGVVLGLGLGFALWGPRP